MIVWMFLDEYASSLAVEDANAWNDEHPEGPPKEPRDIEYEKIEKIFNEVLPNEKLLFSRNKLPSDLRNGGPAYYIFDIGGLDGFTMVGGRCNRFAKDLVEQVKEHENTIFVPWSSFTQSYVEGALCDLLGEECWIEKTIPPNIIILDDKQRREWIEPIILEKLKTLYQARKTKREKK